MPPKNPKRKAKPLKGRTLTFEGGARPISTILLERFKKLGMTRKAFAAKYGFRAREVGHVLRGDLRVHLKEFAGVAYVLGVIIKLDIKKPNLLEKLAWAAEGIDPCKVEGF